MLTGIVELRDVVISYDIDSVRKLAIRRVPLSLEISLGDVAYERAIHAKDIESGPVDTFLLFSADGKVALVGVKLLHEAVVGAGVAIVNRRELPSGEPYGGLIQ